MTGNQRLWFKELLVCNLISQNRFSNMRNLVIWEICHYIKYRKRKKNEMSFAYSLDDSCKILIYFYWILLFSNNIIKWIKHSAFYDAFEIVHNATEQTYTYLVTPNKSKSQEQEKCVPRSHVCHQAITVISLLLLFFTGVLYLNLGKKSY